MVLNWFFGRFLEPEGSYEPGDGKLYTLGLLSVGKSSKSAT